MATLLSFPPVTITTCVYQSSGSHRSLKPLWSTVSDLFWYISSITFYFHSTFLKRKENVSVINVQLVSIQKALLLHSGEYFERLTLCTLWTWISYFRVYCFRHKSNIIFHSKYSSAMMKTFNLMFLFSILLFLNFFILSGLKPFTNLSHNLYTSQSRMFLFLSWYIFVDSRF